MMMLMMLGLIGVHFFWMSVMSMRLSVSGVLEEVRILSGFGMTSIYRLVTREIIGKRAMLNIRQQKNGHLTLSGEIKQIIWPQN
jgi:hypothetical protein